MKLNKYVVLKNVGKGFYSGQSFQAPDSQAAASASPWDGQVLVFPADAGEVFKVEISHVAVPNIRSPEDVL